MTYPCPFTKAVVAIDRPLSVSDGVTDLGAPVKLGELIGAKYAILCPSRRSALRFVLTVVEVTARGAVPVASVEMN